MSYLYDDFKAWMLKQPIRDNPSSYYSEPTINAALYKLKSGLKSLGVQAYENTDCFNITSAAEFKPLYDACYKAAKASDKQAGHSDFRNGLDFYLQFLIQRDLTADDSPVMKKIRELVAAYKADFEKRDKDERYKWIAAGWYKQKWNIEAADFADMYKEAFVKAANLLAANNYFPYRMTIEFSQQEPNTVRALFKVLYDEHISFTQRYSDFRAGFNKYVQPIGKHHYQDPHAVSVYLAFEYPEKYYIYKYSIYENCGKLIGFVEDATDKNSTTNKIVNYNRMCDAILAVAKTDAELLKMSRERLTSDCYQDDAYHLLATDIAYFGSLKETAALLNHQQQYWPPLSEYDPHITKEMWQNLLRDDTVTSGEDLQLLTMILAQGGESTCANLAAIYGNVFGYYNMLGSNYGEKVKNKLNIADYRDESGKVRFYVIPFVGRDVKENGNNRFSWKLRDELKEAMESMKLPDIKKAQDKEAYDFDKNIILYGPPGTGKTYHTAIYAVAIIENRALAAVEAEDYSEVLKRYKQYKSEGRIEFTTFHQSYGYEEFIEGIKPVADNDSEHGNISYSVKSGTFKKFCEKATISAVNENDNLGINSSPVIWKVSLGGTGDNPTRKDCLENGHIRLGWDIYGPDITDETDFTIDGGQYVLNTYINKMRIGDVVLSCYSSTTIDAIGIVTGDCVWHDEYAKYKRQRDVRWLVKGINEDITKINNGRSLTLASVYELNISLPDVMAIVSKNGSDKGINACPAQNFVFIIDEINRGNISKIFGELITLIEADKRLEQAEEMKATLPYSGTPFGVPDNLYIIGTMNTADRSIAVIDTALRRRFTFKEFMPDAEVLNGVNVEGVSIKELLVTMNERIEALYDREHTIGHSYFLPLREKPTIETLTGIFENRIIPLLQEYFYDDYEKIRLVLGDNQKNSEEEQFVVAKKFDNTNLFGEAGRDLDESASYAINPAAFRNIEAYRNFNGKRADGDQKQI